MLIENMFALTVLGSARVSRAGFGVAPKQAFVGASAVRKEELH